MLFWFGFHDLSTCNSIRASRSLAKVKYLSNRLVVILLFTKMRQADDNLLEFFYCSSEIISKSA